MSAGTITNRIERTETIYTSARIDEISVNKVIEIKGVVVDFHNAEISIGFKITRSSENASFIHKISFNKGLYNDADFTYMKDFLYSSRVSFCAGSTSKSQVVNSIEQMILYITKILSNIQEGTL